MDNRGEVRGLPWGNAVRDDVDSGPLPGFHSQSRSQPGAQERRQTSEVAKCIKTDQSPEGRRDTAVVQSVNSRPATMAMAMAMLRRPATGRVAWVWLTFTDYRDCSLAVDSRNDALAKVGSQLATCDESPSDTARWECSARIHSNAFGEFSAVAGDTRPCVSVSTIRPGPDGEVQTGAGLLHTIPPCT